MVLKKQAKSWNASLQAKEGEILDVKVLCKMWMEKMRVGDVSIAKLKEALWVEGDKQERVRGELRSSTDILLGEAEREPID